MESFRVASRQVGLPRETARRRKKTAAVGRFFKGLRMMSIDALKAFGRKVQVDPQLYEKLMNARAAASVQVAAEAGFTFTVEEARAAIQEASDELTDEQLEAVAGGLIEAPVVILKKPSE